MPSSTRSRSKIGTAGGTGGARPACRSRAPSRRRRGCTSSGRTGRSRPRRAGSSMYRWKYHWERSRSVGLGSADDAGDARVRVLRDPLDRAALAGRVAPLEDDDDPGARLRDPVLHLHELFLQPAELLLVGLLRELAGTILGVAMPAVLGPVLGSALALGLGRHRAPFGPGIIPRRGDRLGLGWVRHGCPPVVRARIARVPARGVRRFGNGRARTPAATTRSRWPRSTSPRASCWPRSTRRRSRAPASASNARPRSDRASSSCPLCSRAWSSSSRSTRAAGSSSWPATARPRRITRSTTSGSPNASGRWTSPPSMRRPPRTRTGSS